MSCRPLRLVLVAGALLVAPVATGCSGGEESNRAPGEGQAAVSRDGRGLAFSGEGIHVAGTGGAARRVTDPGKGGDIYPDWSPDGSRIVFERFAEDLTTRGLFVIDRDGSGLRQLTKREDGTPAWSPSGRTIAFTRARGSLGLDGDVRVVDLGGGNEHVLVRNAYDPAWSPDGSKLAFAREGEIAVLDLRTRRIRRVAGPRLHAAAPAWSPDARRIAFEDYTDVRSDSSYVIGIPEIYVVGVDGTGLRRLTRDEHTDWSPAWSRDGRIIFTSFRDGPSRLYVMNSDGTGRRRFR